jgi:hypothetical protein
MSIREKSRLEERAEREGRIARACNTPLAANPYGAPGRRLSQPYQDAWRRAWVRGWNQTDVVLRDDRSARRDRALAEPDFLSDAETPRLPKQAA